MILYLRVLIMFSLRRESFKLILTMNPFPRWFCHRRISAPTRRVTITRGSRMSDTTVGSRGPRTSTSPDLAAGKRPVRRPRLRGRTDVKAGGVREVEEELGETLREVGGGTKRSSGRRAAAMVEWSLSGQRRLRRRKQCPRPALLPREREGWHKE
jgi:hypothetical protein